MAGQAVAPYVATAGLQYAKRAGTQALVSVAGQALANATGATGASNLISGVMGTVLGTTNNNNNALQANALNTSEAVAETSRGVLSTTLTSALALGAMGIGTRTLLQMYGDSTVGTVMGSIQYELARFRQRFAAAPPPRATTAALLLGGPDPSHNWTQWGQTGRGAAEGVGGLLAALPLDSLGFHLLLFGSFLSFLHRWGALDAKAQLLWEHEQRNADALSGAPSAVPSDLTDMRRHQLETRGDWDQLAIRDAAAHARADTRTAQQQQAREEGGVAAQQQQRPFLESKLRNLYLRAPYYDPSRPDGSYYSLDHINVVRILINTMLGFLLQMEYLLRGGRTSSSSSSSHTSGDGFHTTTRVVSGLFFWELLVHALRLHGWGPVHVATQHLVGLLKAAVGRGGR
jgi:hypothetical protein